MVELTLVGWKDPVVLDLPTTDRELKAAATVPPPRRHAAKQEGSSLVFSSAVSKGWASHVCE